jgi:WS/DGAT/MGAT family acyltransferase
MEQLSPQDAQFLYLETDNNLSHVTCVSIYDPGNRTVRFKDIIAHVRSRLDTSPVFTRRLARVPMELDYPYWTDDEYFDLEAHIIHGRLPAPGDWRQFCIHIARYHSRPMDMHRPLWEMYVVEGLDDIEGLPAGSYAVVIKLHHAAVDGAAIMRFLSALSDRDRHGTPAVDLAQLEAVAPAARPNLLQMGYRAALSNLLSPLQMADALVRASPGLQRVAQDMLSNRPQDKTVVPTTRFDAPVSPHKTFDATAFALDDLKAIRKAVAGATINDVILAICSGALRRYLQHHGELPDEPLVAWVPINARPGGASDMGSSGNNISAMTAAIHTDVADPIERLRQISQTTRKGKDAESGIGARLLTDLTRYMPSTSQVLASQLLLRSGMAAKVCNLFVSNVPGPSKPYYMNGAKCVASYGLAPLGEGMGLFIATPSYAGKLVFNVTSTREIMPDIRFFVECLEAALDELKKASQLPRRKTPARKKPAAAVKPKTRPKAKSKSSTKAKAKAKTKSRTKAKTKAPARPKAKSRARTQPRARAG